MEYGICLLSVVPVRREPSESSEMETQVLFGESLEVLTVEGSWTRVRLFHDGYEGWVDTKMIYIPETSYSLDESASVLLALNGVVEDLRTGARFFISAGSYFRNGVDEDGMFYLADRPFRFSHSFYSFLDCGVVEICRSFKGTPYLWGGRTFMGIDCSGFTQIIMRCFNCSLSRNASQQAQEGTKVVSLECSRAGDLAFFSNPSGRITHVGVLTGEGTIIHASGWVREDPVDATGIYKFEQEGYSHHLHSIRRFSIG